MRALHAMAQRFHGKPVAKGSQSMQAAPEDEEARYTHTDRIFRLQNIHAFLSATQPISDK